MQGLLCSARLQVRMQAYVAGELRRQHLKRGSLGGDRKGRMHPLHARPVKAEAHMYQAQVQGPGGVSTNAQQADLQGPPFAPSETGKAMCESWCLRLDGFLSVSHLPNHHFEKNESFSGVADSRCRTALALQSCTL